MPSIIEAITAGLSESTFFRELCFSGQKFEVPQTGELELADVFIWLENTGIIVQVKERERDSGESDGIAKWFDKKVVDKGTKQIADTIRFFSDHPTARVRSSRGIDFQLERLNTLSTHKIIVFGTLASDLNLHSLAKLHKSKRVGAVHLIEATGFVNLLHWLVTPGELLEYLAFREAYLHQHEFAQMLSEKWLFGRFVESGDAQQNHLDYPGWNAETVVDRLADDSAQADLRRFFDHIGEWAVALDRRDSVFRRLLLECALLSRGAMREFKRRIVKCQERMDKPGPESIYRILNPVRGCVFVFGVFPADVKHRLEIGAENLTQLAKYDCETEKAVGFFFTPVEPDGIAITPVYIEYPWHQQPQLANSLKEFNPFRPLNKDAVFGYYIEPGHDSSRRIE